MKCKNCGQNLIFQNGIGFCESCKSSYRFDYGFENIEVYICYVESDLQGRRTKDSIIAEDLYIRLESQKIHTFYERRTTPDLIDEDLQAANYQAIYNAKIILIVGTSISHFESLTSKYKEYFGKKTVIPVYTDIRPGDLPSELNRVQALNLNLIGATTDLLNGILRLLGRENEIELAKLQKQSRKKKKLLAIVLSAFIVICATAISLTFILKKSSTKSESSSELTSQKIYNKAQAMMDAGDYLGAADLLSDIKIYKNSANLYNEIYNKYDGYYISEEESYTLYLNVIEGQTAEFIFERSLDDKVFKIEETATLVNNVIHAKYIDNLSNEGEISIVLRNDKVEVNLVADKKTNNSFDDIFVQFLLTKKTDRPMTKEVTKETILKWMTELTYVEDLKTAGYKLDYIDHSFQYDFSFGTQYKIANTDITIITSNLNLTKYTNQKDTPKLEDNAIYAVIAPATLVCAEKIGQTNPVFTENGVVYVPNMTNFFGGYYDENTQKNYFHFGTGEMPEDFQALLEPNLFTIKNDSPIGMTSRKLLGSENYDRLIEIHQNY